MRNRGSNPTGSLGTKGTTAMGCVVDPCQSACVKNWVWYIYVHLQCQMIVVTGKLLINHQRWRHPFFFLNKSKSEELESNIRSTHQPPICHGFQHDVGASSIEADDPPILP